MPVPNTMSDLSTTAGSNYPVGSESIGNNLDNYLRAHAALIRQSNALAASSMASASTVNVANATGESVQITGTATINSLGTGFNGCYRELRFSAACTLTHSSNLQLPGATNITTAAGDVYGFRCIASGTWVYVGGKTAPIGAMPGFLKTWAAIDPDAMGVNSFTSLASYNDVLGSRFSAYSGTNTSTDGPSANYYAGFYVGRTAGVGVQLGIRDTSTNPGRELWYRNANGGVFLDWCRVWDQQNLPSPASDADVVHKSGNETIAGTKTFAGSVNGDRYYSAAGHFCGNVSGRATALTAEGGSIVLRPNGEEVTTGQAVLTTSGGFSVASLSVSGSATASGFAGSGAGLTGLNAAQLSTGKVPYARIPHITGNESTGSARLSSDGDNNDTMGSLRLLAGGTALVYYFNGVSKAILSDENGNANFNGDVRAGSAFFVGSSSAAVLRPASTGTVFLRPNGTTSNQFSCPTTGICTAPDFQATSDIRLKRNVKPLARGLEDLGLIHVIEYEKNGRPEIGFSAQNVQEIVPEAVSENDEGYLAVSAQQMLALAVKSIQDLKLSLAAKGVI